MCSPVSFEAKESILTRINIDPKILTGTWFHTCHGQRFRSVNVSDRCTVVAWYYHRGRLCCNMSSAGPTVASDMLAPIHSQRQCRHFQRTIHLAGLWDTVTRNALSCYIYEYVLQITNQKLANGGWRSADAAVAHKCGPSWVCWQLFHMSCDPFV